jgi:NMD protein affecting ribosome stability and mRNA decay
LYVENMSVKVYHCIFYGSLGVDLGKVAGKEVAMCPDCARVLFPKIQALLEATAPKRPAKVEKVTPEKFKELVEASVEKRGSLNILDAAKRYGVSAEKAREVAKALADEKGWKIEEARKKLLLKKPA